MVRRYISVVSIRSFTLAVPFLALVILPATVGVSAAAESPAVCGVAAAPVADQPATGSVRRTHNSHDARQPEDSTHRRRRPLDHRRRVPPTWPTDLLPRRRGRRPRRCSWTCAGRWPAATTAATCRRTSRRGVRRPGPRTGRRRRVSAAGTRCRIRSTLQAVWRAAGIDDDSTVVVYDGGSGLAAARAWWLLRWSGLRDVRVLDGGLARVDRRRRPADRAAGRRCPTSGHGDRPARARCRWSTSTGRPSWPLRPSAALIDARAAARFRGEIEPLDPVAGHIPGSVNLPIGDLLTPTAHSDRPAELAAALRRAGAGAGVRRGGRTPVAAASCGRASRRAS